jgi:NhaP-type Na+/H+ or K+/H+ antiporter
MGFYGWVAFAGGLLMLMALSSAWIRRLPISTAMIYLAVGVALGPWGFDLIHIDPLQSAESLLRLTEIGVAFSLFIGGLKLRLSIQDPAWRAAYWLAGPVMVASIAGVALAAWLLLGVAPWFALLLGAVLAPTDPVLASAVSVNDAADEDRLRYGLSGEAGLNDGTAFPFVFLALAWREHGEPGPWLWEWAAHRLLWGVPVALGLGFLAGHVVGRLAIELRTRQRDTGAPSDLLALALIALAYVATEMIGALAFLAAFAAGVGLRRAEMHVVSESPHPEIEDSAEDHPPAEELVGPQVKEEDMQEPAVAAGVLVAETLSFGATAERILEVMLVMTVGVAVGFSWDSRGLLLAGALILLIRPAAVLLLLWRTPTTRSQRSMMAMFGVRGIGSVFYVAFAATHGLTSEEATLLAGLVAPVVAASIVLHGATAQWALTRYERVLKQERRAAARPSGA